MNNKSGYIYMSVICSMFIVTPGRFACGLILVLELLILMVFGTLFRYLIKVMKMDEMKSTLLLFFLIFMTLFFRQLVVITMPLVALQMGFIMFLPAVSTYITSFLFGKPENNLKNELKFNLFQVMKSSIYGIVVSLVRDILGYGTITFIGYNGMIEKVIFPADSISITSFIASVPGSFILAAIILIVYILFLRMFEIIKKSGVEK